jgi:NADPH:quinone reductase-like Zn-dependent oxidoreductase
MEAVSGQVEALRKSGAALRERAEEQGRQLRARAEEQARLLRERAEEQAAALRSSAQAQALSLQATVGELRARGEGQVLAARMRAEGRAAELRSRAEGQAEAARKSVKEMVTGNRQSWRAKDGAPSMRSLAYTGRGGMKMTRCVLPKLKSTQCLVRVLYAGLTEYDYRRGEALGGFLTKEAEPCGLEFCGVVEKLGWVKGDRVHLFPIAVGDLVFGMAFGTVSEFVCAEVDKVHFVPDGMSGEQAASFPVGGLVAWQTLTRHGLAPGQTVMLLGAEQGAMFASLAKLMGAGKVIGLCSDASDQAFCARFCDEVLPLEQLRDRVAEVHLVVDLLSDPSKAAARPEQEPTLYELARPLLRKDARFVQLNIGLADLVRRLLSDRLSISLQKAGFHAVDLKPAPRASELHKLSQWFEQGKLKQPIDSVVPFQEDALLKAFDKLRLGQARGKIVVKFPPPPR